MILRNEAENLARSLAPVAGRFDEIVVVDTGSTDGTAHAAEACGARVVRIEWPDDFAAARNRSIHEAGGDWIMWLDGDNHVAPEGVDRLRTLLDPEKRSIIWCTEVVVPDGERLIQKRVFPRRPDVYFEGRVHEQIVHPPDFRSVMSPVEILHWGYADRAEARRKGERNLNLLFEMAGREPRDQYVCYQLGRTLINLRRFEEATPWLERVVNRPDGAAKNPGVYCHAYILLAKTLNRSNRRKEAGETLRELIGASPEYGPGHYELGRALYAGGEYDRAAECFRLFLDLGVRDPVVGLNADRMRYTALMMLGRCLEKTGCAGDAAAAYEEGARLAPDHPEPPMSLARLAMRQGRPREAEGHLRRCLQVAPGDRRAAGLLAEVARD